MPIKVSDQELAELQANLDRVPRRTQRKKLLTLDVEAEIKEILGEGRKSTKKRQTKEESLQLKFCKYLRESYIGLHFVADVAAGAKLPQKYAVLASQMRSGSKMPDLAIYEARGGFYGLFLELKAEGKLRQKRSGEIKGDAHIQAQAARLAELRAKGYKAEFAEGLYEAVQIVTDYMMLPPTKPYE
jgi:hypothetical protein